MKFQHKIIKYVIADYHVPNLVGSIPKGKTIGKSFSDLIKAFNKADELAIKANKSNSKYGYFVKSEILKE